MEFLTHQLPNGMRLIHRPVSSPVAHAGLFIGTGSRDEEVPEHGVAHLIEHMLFKGTEKRKSFHILSRMENVGGEINAYTTKEETVIYSTFFREYYARALELISDIVFHSSFPVNELQKEKEVILDEINSYKDSPSELIFDEFEELLYVGNPLGRNVLGNTKRLRAFNPGHLKSFIEKNYIPERMVISSVGNIPFKRLVRLFEIYFGGVGKRSSRDRAPFNHQYKPAMKTLNRKTHQAHCIIGGIAYDIKNEKRLALSLLNNVLGGPGMNSRLNLALRERTGFAYTVDSLYTAYTDTGNITVYFGTDKVNLDKCIVTVKRELQKLCTGTLSQSQMLKAKRQLMGQIAISAEVHENHMLYIGKSYMIFSEVDDLETTARKVDELTAARLHEVANEIFDQNQLSYLIYR